MSSPQKATTPSKRLLLFVLFFLPLVIIWALLFPFVLTGVKMAWPWLKVLLVIVLFLIPVLYIERFTKKLWTVDLLYGFRLALARSKFLSEKKPHEDTEEKH